MPKSNAFCSCFGLHTINVHVHHQIEFDQYHLSFFLFPRMQSASNRRVCAYGLIAVFCSTSLHFFHSFVFFLILPLFTLGWRDLLVMCNRQSMHWTQTIWIAATLTHSNTCNVFQAINFSFNLSNEMGHHGFTQINFTQYWRKQMQKSAKSKFEYGLKTFAWSQSEISIQKNLWNELIWLWLRLFSINLDYMHKSSTLF